MATGAGDRVIHREDRVVVQPPAQFYSRSGGRVIRGNRNTRETQRNGNPQLGSNRSSRRALFAAAVHQEHAAYDHDEENKPQNSARGHEPSTERNSRPWMLPGCCLHFCANYLPPAVSNVTEGCGKENSSGLGARKRD